MSEPPHTEAGGAARDAGTPGALDPADAALAGALDPAGGEDAAVLSLEEVATRAGIPTAALEAMVREGLLTPREVDGVPRFTEDDAAAVTAGRRVLDTGIPLAELLELARRHEAAMHPVAEQAVDLFVRYVRDPVHASTPSAQDAATRLVDAFQQLLPATSELVGHSFRRLVVNAAQERIARELADAGEDG